VRGIPYSSPFYQRQAECGYRGGYGRSRAPGQLSLKQDRTGLRQDYDGLLRWVAPGWAADDASWWGSKARLAPKLTGPIANRKWWRGAPLDQRYR
jgi:hypothetical protein